MIILESFLNQIILLISIMSEANDLMDEFQSIMDIAMIVMESVEDPSMPKISKNRTPIGYDTHGRVIIVGSCPIGYDNEKLTRIGGTPVGLEDGELRRIGGAKITYDPDTYKITRIKFPKQS